MDILLQICLAIIVISFTSVIATMSSFFVISFFKELLGKEE